MGRLLSTHIQHLVLTGAGVLPTIPDPVTLSPESASWKSTDIMQGEWAHNITDDIWYYRKADNTIAAFSGAPEASLVEVNAGSITTKYVSPGKLSGSKYVINRTALTDGAAIAADCLSYDQKMFYLDSAQTASTMTVSNVGKVVDVSINKQGTGDLVVTLSGTGMVFDIYDSTNKCYTRGTTITLSRAVANTTFKLNFVVTGLTSSGDSVVQVAGTFSSFS